MSRGSRQQSGLATANRVLTSSMVVVFLLAASCSSPPSAELAEPHQGRWMLLSLSGTIEVEHQGKPVLCPEGAIVGQPQLATTDGKRSFMELDGDRFLFSLLFDHQGSLETFTNGEGAEHSFDLHWLGLLGPVRTGGTWSSTDGLHGLVAMQMQDPDDDQASVDVAMVVDGQLDGNRAMRGTWSYREQTAFSDCFSTGSGSGTWTAVPGPDEAP